LRSFQKRLADFDSRGVHLAAISVDPVDVTRAHCQKMGYTFPFLSDQSAEVIRRYDVLHRGAGPKNNDIARPAEFFVDANGRVQWVNLTENIAVRARPEQALEAIGATKAGGRN
jgi:peroxiredoxin